MSALTESRQTTNSLDGREEQVRRSRRHAAEQKELWQTLTAHYIPRSDRHPRVSGMRAFSQPHD